jgi:hypothetical protein
MVLMVMHLFLSAAPSFVFLSNFNITPSSWGQRIRTARPIDEGAAHLIAFGLLRSINVQTHLLFPVGDGDVTFGGGDDNALLRRRRAEVLAQVNLDSENIPLNGHLDVFHGYLLLPLGCPSQIEVSASYLKSLIYTYSPK